METGWSVFCLLLLENTRYRYTLVREREEVARKKPQRVRLFISKCPDIKNTNRIKETGVKGREREWRAMAITHKVSHRETFTCRLFKWNIFFISFPFCRRRHMALLVFCSGKIFHYNSDATVVVRCNKREREPPAIVSFYVTMTGCWRSKSNHFTSALQGFFFRLTSL